MSIEFNNKENAWYAKNDNIHVKYSIKKFGIYAEMMAKCSDITNIEYRNIILDRTDYYIIKIFSKSYGEVDVKFDKIDLDLVLKHTWHIGSKKLQYCNTSINGKTKSLHRLIFKRYNNIKKGYVVDHLGRDTMDCRRQNLRLISKKENTQNRSIHKNNISGIIGVRKRGNSWVAKWRDENGNEKTKTFSENKYHNAKELAIRERKKHTKHYNKFKLIKVSRC